jgi:hypothetical protein
MSEKPEVVYLLSVTKTTAMSGEQITINTSIPQSSSGEQISAEINKITGALNRRASEVNATVLEITRQNMRKAGVDEKKIEEACGPEPKLDS